VITGCRAGEARYGRSAAAAHRSLETAFAERGAEVARGPLPTVAGDRAQLELLFRRVLDNVLAFRAETPLRVRIEAVGEGALWRFAVEDNGVGIAPENLERVFAPFCRIRGGDGRAGIGLGLATCRKIVESHGGAMWATSASGRGAVVHFTLPDAAVLQDAAAASSAASASAAQA
jgi:signal transduction histidine kinase